MNRDTQRIKMKLADQLEKEMGDHEMASRNEVASAQNLPVDKEMEQKAKMDRMKQTEHGTPEGTMGQPEPNKDINPNKDIQDQVPQGPWVDPNRNKLMNKVEDESAMAEGSPEEEANESPEEEKMEDEGGDEEAIPKGFRGMSRGKRA